MTMAEEEIAMNGEIVTESESEDESAEGAELETLVDKKTAAIMKQIRIKRAKLIAQQNFEKSFYQGTQYC